jgi:hypothetical protein
VNHLLSSTELCTFLECLLPRQRGSPYLLSVGASPNSRLIEGERVCSKPCLWLLWGVLGLPAVVTGAVPQCLEPRL